MGVRWNSARTRHWTRMTAKEARKQTRMMQFAQRQQLAQAAAAQPPPAGWYADPYGAAALRWWDGTRWTEHLQAQR